MRLVVQIIRVALLNRFTEYMTNWLVGYGPIPVFGNRIIGGDCGVGKAGVSSLRDRPAHQGKEKRLVGEYDAEGQQQA